MRIILLIAAITVVGSTNVNDRSIFKTDSERSDGKTLSASEVVLIKREAKQIADEGASGTRPRRQVLKDFGNASTIWKNGVFYVFNTTDETVQKAFRKGVQVWSENTCVDFFENSSATDKVVVQKSNECSSYTGRLGGDQTLCLNDRYTASDSAIHEIGHALGLIHTVRRFDRNNFVTVAMQNLDPDFFESFEKLSWAFAEAYGLAYDYGSVMHGDELSGSANGQRTIIALDAHHQKTMGSSIIAFSDIFIINKRYGCDEWCDNSTSAQCMNEGFPHPRNCSICICPSGYGGALCDRRPPGCGEDLVATRGKKTLSYRLGYGFGIREHFDFCNFMIMAPEGRKIEVDLKSISLGYDNPGCNMGGVEIKARTDHKMTGYRFCSVNGSGGPIVSSFNRMPVILYNRFTYMDVNLTYHYID